ncbi:substrate-binding domain-containing protein [Alkalisalibacterium limincola]|uniref:Phosphonate ABC transporter substrate-binding protein n=1 Tax=Alkalisalibacterium limincola TaxID=2699169 RepID=A0A5C8L0J4_9GAMM|nr:substrate-binding domain-containing protein [Alkalisalibacterium limincola]TXK65941.1 phosphonate ABC transporter substrate-binding protein [Alkalisalibacterium limincola]
MSFSGFNKLALGVAVAAALALPAAAFARDNIQAAGSSTVLPFSSIAAEEFGNNYAQFRTPVIGSGGTGGGMRQFCAGVGTDTIDIGNASRAITDAEKAACRENGVTEVIEVKFGYDGIVFASRSDSGTFALEPKHVFLAQAAQIPRDGQMVANPYTRWNQIDPSLPDQEIVLAIPGSNHGTREVYDLNVVRAGCNTFDEVKALEGDARNQFCDAIRTDGRMIEIAGDYTETLARLAAQRDALGVFGLSFYENNRDRLKVATVSGVTPSVEAILSGEYPVSRPLYFYVKGDHIGVIPGLQEFAQYFVSDALSGEGSPLEEAGLIPLSDEERAEVMENIRSRNSVL